MSATSTDSAIAAAPQQQRSHVPMVFRHGSTQIVESETEYNPSPGTPSGGGGSGTASPAAAQSLRFSATCQAADAVGRAVRMDGAANAVTTVTSSQPYPTVGIIVAKASATSCTVQTYGLVTGAVANMAPLQRYFVGPTGDIVTSANVFAAGQYVQLVGFAVTASTLFVQPSGTIGQLAAAHNANGDDATPEPSDDGRGLLYGGVLYGSEAPAADYGRKGDSFFCYQPEGGVLLFGPKADSGWGAPRSLKGQSGNRIYIRDTAPDDSVIPQAGDIWLDKVAYNLYPAE